uniref:Uncharacterized protein n=1 Tax=Anguilla anguilla TaxID=7936 RepID=A0A0E9QBU7_ANGAN
MSLYGEVLGPRLYLAQWPFSFAFIIGRAIGVVLAAPVSPPLHCYCFVITYSSPPSPIASTVLGLVAGLGSPSLTACGGTFVVVKCTS